MKVLVIFDSVYGNTQKVAEAIGGAIVGEVKVVRASQIDTDCPGQVDLLAVGAPTQGGRPTQPVLGFLAKVPEAVVKDTKVAAFDTRYAGRFVKIFGFAADRIAEALVAKGGKLIAPPEAFFVTGKKGPLKEGELERAASWARKIAGS